MIFKNYWVKLLMFVFVFFFLMAGYVNSMDVLKIVCAFCLGFIVMINYKGV